TRREDAATSPPSHGGEVADGCNASEAGEGVFAFPTQQFNGAFVFLCVSVSLWLDVFASSSGATMSRLLLGLSLTLAVTFALLHAAEEPDRAALRKKMERAMGPLPGADRKVPLDAKVIEEEVK